MTDRLDPHTLRAIIGRAADTAATILNMSQKFHASDGMREYARVRAEALVEFSQGLAKLLKEAEAPPETVPTRAGRTIRTGSPARTVEAQAMPADTVTMSREGPQLAVYVCLSCMRRISLTEVWQMQEPERSAPTYTHRTADGHPVVRIDGLLPADVGGCEELRALVREWQMARRPSQLPAPGADLVETYRHAVQHMAVVDEALARFNLGGPAGGALVGQTAPTESTGPYTDEYAVETLMHLARTLSEVDEQHSCLRGALAIKAIAARAQGVGRAVSQTPVSDTPDACENCGTVFDDVVMKWITWDDIELCEGCSRELPEVGPKDVP